jgi:hypothetical protein
MGADCKSADYIYASSNLARPIHTCLCSSVVEHTLGKGEVMSSILIIGLLLRKAIGYLFVVSKVFKFANVLCDFTLA